jgi:hypothetical protein
VQGSRVQIGAATRGGVEDSADRRPLAEPRAAAGDGTDAYPTDSARELCLLPPAAPR